MTVCSSEQPSRERSSAGCSNLNNAFAAKTGRVAGMKRLGPAALVVVCAVAIPGARPLEPPALADAQHLFYNARYEETVALTRALSAPDLGTVAILELRTSALLFQLKGLVEDRPKNALKTCATCPALVADFAAEFNRGKTLARSALAADPRNDAALFFLGKLDLNYVWLQLGPLQRKTGWDEYWEARASLDEVLRRNPRHVRARVARAWISYIVDTRLPWGTRWLLGGGDRKQALADMQEAAQMDTDFFAHVEAEFGLWDMRVRERDLTRATDVARRLAETFPDNRELAAFLDGRAAGLRR